MSGTAQVMALAALFEQDHEPLLKMLEDVTFLCRKGSYLPAAKVYGELRHSLERHLEAEEAALAKLVREGVCPESLSTRISSDHAALRKQVEQTWLCITRHKPAAVANALGDLSRALTAHERTEQLEVLPVLCAGLSDPSKLERAVRQLVEH